jgi:transposase InsO family protein
MGKAWGVSTTACPIFHRPLSLLSKAEHTDKPNLCSFGFTTSTYRPLKCLNIDFFGPFTDDGYVLVIVDTFTRCVDLYHTLDATALSAAQCLLKHFGRFGAPLQFRSDNGPHFVADVIRECLLLIGTQECLAIAYLPERGKCSGRTNEQRDQSPPSRFDF